MIVGDHILIFMVSVLCMELECSCTGAAASQSLALVTPTVVLFDLSEVSMQWVQACGIS